MELKASIILLISASLALAAGSCAPSPRLSRSSERISTPDKGKSPNSAEKTRTPAVEEDDQEPGDEPSASKTEADEVLQATETPAAADEPEKTRRSPRDAKEVARRALILRAVGTVALYPRASESTSASTMEFFDAKREHIIAELKKEGLWASTSKNEKALLSTPVGTKSERTPIDPGEASEALLVLLWALGPVKRLPEFDTPSPGITMLSAALPEVDAPTADFVNGAKLRPDGEIEHAMKKAWFWSLRAQLRQRIADGKFQQGKELDLLVQELDAHAHVAGFRLGPIRDGRSFYRELIRFTAFDCNKQGLITNPIKEDFPVKGKSYAELTDREFKKVQAIAANRLHALEWIRGERASWDSTSEKG